MKSRIDQVKILQQKKYNCTQVVFCNYADLVGLEEETAFKLSEGFGGGFGRLGEVCGVISAMTMLLGMKYSVGNTTHGASKEKTYAIVSEQIQKFKTMNGSILCRELLGSETSPKLRTCSGCMEDACQIIEENIFPELFM